MKMNTILAMAFLAGAQSMAWAQGGMATPAVITMQAEDFARAAGGAQVKDDLFAGTEKFEKGATDVTEINLDPKMMGMVPVSSGAAGLAKKMKFMVIHTYTYDKPGMYNQDDVDAYRRKLEDGTWNCSIHTKDKNGTTDICSRTSSDHESSEMVILTAEPKELTFIHMSGNMSLDELEKMHGGSSSQRRALPAPPALPNAPASPR
jgi:hypothetical protein